MKQSAFSIIGTGFIDRVHERCVNAGPRTRIASLLLYGKPVPICYEFDL